MQDCQTQQDSHRWNVQTRENSLFIQFKDENITYQGFLNSNQHFNLNIIKQIIKRGESEILQKDSTKMKIRIMSIIDMQLQNSDQLEIQSLKMRIQFLQNQLKKVSWQQEDINSTKTFDTNYLYRVQLNNLQTVMCSSVGPYALWFLRSGSQIECLRQFDRKVSSNETKITKIWKQQVL